jgi:hypothetical protein
LNEEVKPMKQLILLFNLIPVLLAGQDIEKTVGVTILEYGAYDAYTLFSPARDKQVYLIDNCGAVVHQWQTESNPGNAVYLLEDGSLYRAGQVENTFINAGGAGGIIEKFDWDGNRIWSYTYSSSEVRAHHDFQVLPNGNVLILAWEKYTRNEAIENGMDPTRLDEGVDEIWPEHIIEVVPTGNEGGNIVWEWHVWDHLVQEYDDQKLNYAVVADNAGKIDINHVRPGKTAADWQHANAINYNPELDQILLSVLNFDEVWVIDHDITSEESKGEKGNLLFRWGNPQAYNRGGPEDQKLFGQHNAQWIASGLPDEGKILIFNNGQDRFPDDADLFTAVVKIDPTLSGGQYQTNAEGQFLPADYYYEYTKDPPTEFYSRFISGAQQLPNGNILIDDGAHGTFFELDEDENIVWQYINPITINGPLTQGDLPTAPNGNGINTVFRATKYAKNYPAFDGKNLTPGETIEINGDFSLCLPLGLADNVSINIYPNPATETIKIEGMNGLFELVDLNGAVVMSEEINTMTNIDVTSLKSGLYLLRIDGRYYKKIQILR